MCVCVCYYWYIHPPSLFLSLPLPSQFPAAYGYGFLMVTAVSLLSLLGLILLPFITKNSKLAGIYEYISTLLIALGASAVLSGAILHLLPRVMQNYVNSPRQIHLQILILYRF